MSKTTPRPWRWNTHPLRGGFSGIAGPNNEEVIYPLSANDGDDGAAWFDPEDAAQNHADYELIITAVNAYDRLRADNVKLREALEAAHDFIANRRDD